MWWLMKVEEKAEGKGQSSICSQVQGNGYSQFLLLKYFRNTLKTHEAGLKEEVKRDKFFASELLSS